MQTQLRMESFYSFNERFAKIRSKRIKKAVKGITGKNFPDTDEPDQDNPSTSKTTKKKGANSSTGFRGRGKRKTDAGLRNIESEENNEIGIQEDDKVADSNNFADTVEFTKENNSSKNRKKGSTSGRSKGRGQCRMNAGRGTTGTEEDSDTKSYASASDEDSHKRHASNYKSEEMALRRVSSSNCVNLCFCTVLMF
jgi:DNA excision repair protein ERCC-5